MKITTQFLAVIFLVTLGLDSALAFSTGAPSSEAVCKSMTPKHGGAAQTDAVPVTVELGSTDVKGGDKVTITIKGTAPFKGFMVMGHKVGTAEDSGMPHGSFDVATKSKALSCGGKADGALTHDSADPKTEQILHWNAPNEDGEYMIFYSIVKDKPTYWVKAKTPVIKVKADPNKEKDKMGPGKSGKGRLVSSSILIIGLVFGILMF